MISIHWSILGLNRQHTHGKLLPSINEGHKRIYLVSFDMVFEQHLKECK